MAAETPDIFDTNLQQLFAGIVPDGGFEDRLVAALRPPRRMVIPGPVAKAAIAAAAMLAVGVTGYVGNHYLLGGRELAWRVKSASNLHQIGLAILLDDKDNRNLDWDYGGGSNRDQSWSNLEQFHGAKQNLSFSYENPFSSSKPIADGWQLKNTESSYGIAGDIKEDKKGTVPFSPSPLAVQRRAAFIVDRNSVTPSTGNENNGQSPPSGSVHGIDGTININTAPPQVLASLPEEQNRKEAPPAATPPIDAPKLPMDFYYAANDGRNKDANGSVILQGENAYTGKTSVAGGAIQLGTDANKDQQQLRFQHAVHEDPKGGRSNLGIAEAAATKNDVTMKQVDSDAASHQPAAADKPPVTEAETAFDPSLLRSLVASNNPVAESTAPTTQATIIDDRKIIRTGTMEFDVDRFDTAQMQITKIVGELGGFVGATDSTKLPNGKVRGSIAVRIPPGHLDTLVLSLRALGDLKSQQITAADITKEYTDIESELAADRAMQDRLLDLIHNGKGAVKDLLAAENELGNWRTKIEKAEGMIRYYNAQVAMSTLTITLSEKDIQNPAAAVETETADMGIEAADVEKARAAAMKSIDDVKGRIISAELKRFDAGQLAAKLVADVPPESAGAVIDQLKLIGKVARLEIQRQQSTTDGSAAVTNITSLRTERKPTRLLISIYNLANVAPRKTTNVNLAATDVEAAYAALAAVAKSSGGRVVTSNLDRSDPVRTTGSLVLEFPPEQFESAMTTLKSEGDVLKLTTTENPDTQNSTEAKQGLTVQLVSLASVPARETIQQTIAAVDVAKAYQAVLDAVNSAQLTVHQGAVAVTATVPHSHGRVQSAQLNEQDRQNVTADLQLEIPRATEDDFDKALAAAGVSISRTSTQAINTDNAVDSKVQVHLSITSADHLPARETTKLQVEVPDVDKAAGAAQALAIADGGRVLESTINRDHGKGIARLVLDVPLEKAGEALQQLREAGSVRGIDSTRDPQAPAGQFAHAIIGVEFATGDAIVADQTGPWAAVRQGLSTSINGLLWSLQWIVVGLCLLGPWVLLTWGGWKILRRRKTSAVA